VKKFTVAAFGELLWDILPSQTVLGGAPFNFAYRVTQLGDLAIPVTRVGDDELGVKARDQVRSLGVPTDLVQIDSKHPTGTVQVRFDQNQNPDYFIVPDVAYDYIAWNEQLEMLAGKADCICFGSLIQRGPVSRRTLYELLSRSRQSLKFLDINLRRDCYDPENMQASLERAHVLKLNESELHEVGKIFGLPGNTIPELTTRVRDAWSLEAVIVTLAERGVFAMSTLHTSVYLPGYRVNVADPVGSGDAFSAGFLSVWLRGGTLLEACTAGNRIGALVATQTGGTTLFDKEALDRFEETYQGRNVEPSLTAHQG